MGIINSEKYIIEGDEMELIYMWVEEYKNIKKQGFNFSPNHWFEVVPYKGDKPSIKYELIDKMIDEREEKNKNGELREQPSNFFGENISNVNVIVGKNGSGKSNLFERLIFRYFIEDIGVLTLFKDENSNFFVNMFFPSSCCSKIFFR